MSESNELDNGQLPRFRCLPSRTARGTWEVELPPSWIEVIRDLQTAVARLAGELDDVRKELAELKDWKKEYEPWVEKAKRRLEGRKE